MKTWPLWIMGTLAGAAVTHLAVILTLANIAGGN